MNNLPLSNHFHHFPIQYLMRNQSTLTWTTNRAAGQRLRLFVSLVGFYILLTMDHYNSYSNSNNFCRFGSQASAVFRVAVYCQTHFHDLWRFYFKLSRTIVNQMFPSIRFVVLKALGITTMSAASLNFLFVRWSSFVMMDAPFHLTVWLSF